MRGSFTQQRIFRIEGGLEIDDMDYFNVTRRRVFFDDVVLVTFHRFRGKAFLWGTAIATLLIAALAALVGISSSDSEATIVFALMATPFLIAFLVRMTFGVDVITVWGRRTKAVLHFSFRKSRARRVFGQLLADIRASQRALGMEIARHSPPKVDLPAPPADDAAPPEPEAAPDKPLAH